MRDLVLYSLLYCGAMRVFEVWLGRRNLRRLLARGGRLVEDPSWVSMIALHSLWFVSMILEEHFRAPQLLGGVMPILFGSLFVLAECMRLLCIRTLGERWNVRVVVLDETPPVIRGPYRWLQHPNYLAALVMIGSLPLALGLYYTAILFVPLKLALLRQRIRIEDQALGR